MHSLDPSLPYLLYLPNLDGAGLTCKPQWPRMATQFNLHTLSIPPDNRCDFGELLDFVKASRAAACAGAALLPARGAAPPPRRAGG
jgi:hypothetical protein